MREGFESTVKICHRVLESRNFEVTKGGVRVVLLLKDQDRDVPNCRDFEFGVTLSQSKDWWPDDEVGTCKATTGGNRSFSFSNLGAGTYYLTIWRLFDHPYCCLEGEILVYDEPVASDSSGCTRDTDPSVMDVVHGALDIAGFIPVLGAIPDGINAVIYAAEGDWTNAGISVVAMVPVFGDGAKVVVKGGKEVIEASGKTVIKMGKEELGAGLKKVAQEKTEKEALEKAAKEAEGEAAKKGTKKKGGGGGISCHEHMVACMLTSLADEPGSVYGSSRCLFCAEVCKRDGGIWPTKAPTTKKAVRCDYWNYPSQE